MSRRAGLRARLASHAIRLTVRRRDWGPPDALARRARRWFGAPRPLQWWRARGTTLTPASVGGVRGEWVTPRPETRRVVLYFHGGGYVACSPATHRPITAALARLTPARVFAPDYRLAPEDPYPAALDDAERVYRGLLADGLAASEIVVGGDSAGGGLALALLLRLGDRGIERPACAVLFSPWTDLSGSGASVESNDGRCAMFRRENIAAFAACYAPPSEWRNPEVSPVFGRLDGLPPLHVQVDESEILLDDAVRVHRAVESSGGSSELVVYEGLFHGWQMLDGLLPESRRALTRAAGFLASRARSAIQES